MREKGEKERGIREKGEESGGKRGEEEIVR